MIIVPCHLQKYGHNILSHHFDVYTMLIVPLLI